MKSRLLLVFVSFGVVAGLAAGCAATKHNDANLRHTKKKEVRLGSRSEAFNHYLTATLLEKQGEFDKAVAEMQLAAKQCPESGALTLRLIRAYLRQEDFQSALTMAEKAVDQMPDSANLWVILGEIYHRLDRQDDAVNAFNKAIAIDPGNILGYGALVSLEESSNDLIAAVDVYNRLAELSPKSPRVHFQLGLCYAKMNDPANASKELKAALALDPNLVRALYVLGIIELEAGEYASAKDHLVQYVTKLPDDVRGHESLAGVLGRLGETDAALEQFNAILSGGQAEPRVYVETMYLLARANRHDRLVEIPPPAEAPVFTSLFRAIEQKNSGADYAALANSLDGIDGDIAAECDLFLHELLYLFDKDAAGKYLLDNLLAMRDSGIKSRVIDIVAGRTLLALNKYAEAEPILLDALQRVGDDKDLHYSLAIVSENLNKIPEAEAHLKAYLKLVPDDPEILNFLGFMYAENNIKLDEAEALLKRALELEPQSGFYLDSLGWVYYRRGDADKAIDYIRRAILAMDNDDAELRNHLGDAYLLKGDTEKALAEWTRAQRLNPKLEGVADKIKQHQK